MAATASTMTELGLAMPSFSLTDACTGKVVSSDDLGDAPAVVVAFICNHCPFVKHIAPALAVFGRECDRLGGAMVALSSNDVEYYPDDAPGKMAAEAKRHGYTFPYLYDETQEIAKAFKAACTPDFFIYDKARALAYRGQFDDSRPGNGRPVTGQDLLGALEAIVAGRPASSEQQASIGCNIKWKPGGEPGYA